MKSTTECFIIFGLITTVVGIFTVVVGILIKAH